VRGELAHSCHSSFFKIILIRLDLSTEMCN